MRKSIFTGTILLLSYCAMYSQISTREEPISFRTNIPALKGYQSTLKTLPSLDMERIQQEDMEDEANGIPPRFGYLHEVNYNLDNSGEWTVLTNGDKIWRLSVSCPVALSINLLYDKFWLPDGAKFFIYSNDRKHTLGAFTSVNNKGDKEDIQGFATGLVYGDQVILEYYLPNEAKDVGEISVAYVVHGYQYIRVPENSERGFGDSGDCRINVNCSPEGDNWKNEKNAVALILINGNRMCTGSLVNNTANDNRPLFLTANHCLGIFPNGGYEYDAINRPNLNHWSFCWHYESPDCNNIDPTVIHSTVGATVIANSSVSDFALLELKEDPRNKAGVTPYYLGWDRSGNSGTGGVGIHHPHGDIKKISTYSISPFDSYCANSNLYWDVKFDVTNNGYSVPGPGSSGSPLINGDHRVIGQLYGPYNLSICPGYECDNPSLQQIAYGKFSVSWTGNNAIDPRRRLKDWLDPLGMNVTILNGTHCTTLTNFTNQTVTTNTTITTGCSINVQNVTVTTGTTLTLDAEGSVTLGGGFEMQPGSGLEIK